MQRPMRCLRELGDGRSDGWLNILLGLPDAQLILIVGWFLDISGLGGSVPVVVLMLAEQLQRFGGLGEDPDGFGTPHLNSVSITLPGEDVGDPINGGFEPDRITSSSPGNNQLQPMLGSPAEPHKPLLRRQCCLLFGTDRVGLDDGGLQQGL